MEPAGIIMPFAGTTAPEGYLMCDGAAVSRTTYATLFAVIGTTFGAGDGSTTFNVPDLSGRVPLGVSSAHLLGSMGGSETVTLTEQELPAHVHEVPQHGHADTIAATTPELSHSITAQPSFTYNNPTVSKSSSPSNADSNVYGGTSSTGAVAVTAVAITAHAVSDCTMGGSVTNKAAFDTENYGGNDSHNNMQPFLVVTYIISTGV